MTSQTSGLIEDSIKALSFRSASTFRPATLIGTPNTPKFLGWLAPKFDGILPKKFASSKINVLAAAMVRDAETALAAAEADSPFTIFEGVNLHHLYAQIVDGAGGKEGKP